MKILLANPRGFCAGVDRAILIVERALELFGAPIYVRHEVVHNRQVVDRLQSQGVVFTDEVEEIPEESVAIFSAHGVSQAVRQQASDRRLKVFDATCPLVTKVHMEVARYSKQNIECILIGHSGHPEVEGTLGQYDSPEGAVYLVESVEDVAALALKHPDCCGYVTQTTLSVDDTKKVVVALRDRFPKIMGPKKDDICYATQNRQDAVKALTPKVQVMLVVGSQASSNSNRLRELAENMGVPAYLLDDADDVQAEWLDEVTHIGLTAGASTPESVIQSVVQKLVSLGAEPPVELGGVEEPITFALPKELRKAPC